MENNSPSIECEIGLIKTNEGKHLLFDKRFFQKSDKKDNQ